MTPNFWAPACTHTSAVAALALRPSGACQTYQSPPQPPGPPEGWAGCRLGQPSHFQQGVTGDNEHEISASFEHQESATTRVSFFVSFPPVGLNSSPSLSPSS